MDKEIATVNVRSNIEQFLRGNGRNKGRAASERYASFDYCYNYFQSFREKGIVGDLGNQKHAQTSCLQLALYLASWGMFRGSSFLLEKSARHFLDTIKVIAHCDDRIWSIDIDDYSRENIGLLLDLRKQIIVALGTENGVSDILVTKIMLGVFANTPAFDSFLRAGLHVGTFNAKSLNRLSSFYHYHREAIDNQRICTFDFESGNMTSRPYTKAKIVDMIGFIEGKNLKSK